MAELMLRPQQKAGKVFGCIVCEPTANLTVREPMNHTPKPPPSLFFLFFFRWALEDKGVPALTNKSAC